MQVVGICEAVPEGGSPRGHDGVTKTQRDTDVKPLDRLLWEAYVVFLCNRNLPADVGTPALIFRRENCKSFVQELI